METPQGQGPAGTDLARLLVAVHCLQALVLGETETAHLHEAVTTGGRQGQGRRQRWQQGHGQAVTAHVLAGVIPVRNWVWWV